MIRYIFLALGIYVLYKLVFDFAIPIFRASRKIHQQFSTMHQQMQDQMNQSQNTFQKENPSHTKKTPPAGDYIDFEEIK